MTIPVPTPMVCWPLDDTCLPPAWGDLDPAVVAAAQEQAEAVLTNLTLARVGGCPITVRPCAARPGRLLPYGTSPQFTPYLGVDGQVRNAVCGHAGACSGNCEIDLGTVIGRVDEIKVDGVAVDITDNLAVIDGHILAWRGTDPCPFPYGNDMSLADTEAGTWSITYLPRHPVDAAGAVALAWLTFELAKANCGGPAKGCRLPSNVVAVVRQGVSLELIPGLFARGSTGIREVDSWIRVWNPDGKQRRTGFFNPQAPRHRVEAAL